MALIKDKDRTALSQLAENMTRDVDVTLYTQRDSALIVPGVVLEHFLDLRLYEAERRAGLSGGTVRTIEGPLYIAGAPLSKGEARLDDDTDDGEVLFVEGQVRDALGKPIAGAVVDVWHANTRGNY